ncbi:MAG: hypothetical protein NZM31_06160 [Gemmatales bacterium]|nr:hypothetical protein [Gemmatales bacterium]MDW8386582.1 hypothetical protein [Gemmatales bacterium]
MSRKSFLVTLGLIVLLGAVVLTVVVWLLSCEPELYVQAEMPAGPDRVRLSQEFEKRAFDLFNEIQNEDDWEAEFTEQQINSWLAEDFVESNLARQLPEQISEPRVALRPGKLFLAFRYGGPDFNTVVSLEGKVWIAPREPNTLALEIESFKAGAIPLSPRFLQQELTEGARQNNIDVQWYRKDGHPVAVFRLQADRRDPGVQLRELELKDGALRVKGRSLDPSLRGMPEWPFSIRKAGSS